MKYLVRVIKYFIFICIIMTLIMGALMLSGVVSSDIDALFRNGYDSLWQIALMFLAVSALYPKFGFSKRGAIIPGTYDEIRPGLMDYMTSHGYVLESEDGENLTFRRKSPIHRLTRMLEDRLTFTRELPGFYIEGLTKDVIKIVGGLEYKFRQGEE